MNTHQVLMSGMWQGSYAQNGKRGRMSMELSFIDSTIDGKGKEGKDAVGAPFVISGTYDYKTGQCRFKKQYIGITQSTQHSVLYEGQLLHPQIGIYGRWTIQAMDGGGGLSDFFHIWPTSAVTSRSNEEIHLNLDGLCEAELNLSGCQILTRLDGLHNAPNLVRLNMSECPMLAQVGCIHDCPHLEAIEVSNCKALRHIDGFQRLPALRKLTAEGCDALLTLEHIRDCPKLEQISLSHCGSLGNISFLHECRNTKMLLLQDVNCIRSLSDIVGLTNLEFLDLSQCQWFESLRGGESLKQLGSLVLDKCAALRDLSGIDALASLESLSAKNCDRLESLAEIGACTRLKTLDLENSQVRDISCLSGLAALETLVLSCHPEVTDISVVSALESLKSLWIWNCFGWNGDCDLTQADQLKFIGIGRCPSVSKGSHLLLAPSVEAATLQRIPLRDLSLLEGARRLQTVFLYDCHSLLSLDGLPTSSLDSVMDIQLKRCSRLSNLAGLKFLKKLQTVKIADCPEIRDLTELVGMRDLRTVELDRSTEEAAEIVVSAAVARKDSKYIESRKDELLRILVASDHIDSLSKWLSQACALDVSAAWAADLLEKIITELNKRGGGRATWDVVLSQCVHFPDPTLRRFFTLVPPSAMNWATMGIPYLNALGLAAHSAREWAVELIDGLLSSASNMDLRQIGPSVCLFYASVQRDDRVREWLRKLTDPSMSVWADRIHAALAKRDIASGDIASAKIHLAEMVSDSEKDVVYDALAQELASKAPEDAGDAFDCIVNALKRGATAQALGRIPQFTAKTKNIYRLILASESDSNALSALLSEVLLQHPDSKFACELVRQFAPAQGTGNTLSMSVREILDDPAVSDTTGRKKLLKFKDAFLSDPHVMRQALIEGILTRMIADRLITQDDREELLKTLTSTT